MNMMKNLSRLLLTLCVLSISTSAFAQTARVNRYATTTFTGSWSSISSTGTSMTATSQDDGYATFPLGIPFNYDSANYNASSTMVLNTNGWISFTVSSSTEYTSGYQDQTGASTYAVNSLLPYSVDLYHSSTSQFYYQTTGSAPNRVFTIEYANWCSYLNTADYTAMQVKLYESTNVIEFIYKVHNQTEPLADGAYAAGVGLNGNTSPSFVYNRYTNGLTATPSTDIRFTPPLNVPPAELLLSPTVLNYSGVSAGSNLTLYDTAYNLGPGYLKLNSFGVTGSTAYSIVSAKTSTGRTINPGDSILANDWVAFGIKFAPTQSGNLNATFFVNSSGKTTPNQTCVLSGTGLAANVQYTFVTYNGVTYPDNTLFHHVATRFGQPVSQKFLVTSNGTGPLSFYSITLSGLQSNMYAVTHVPPNPLPVGVTDSIVVTFTPYYEGRPDATLTVNTNAINQPVETVTLWGTAILPHLVVTPQEGIVATGTTNGTLTFDSVAIGDSVCKTLALHNTGTDTLQITKQLITYGDYDYTYYGLAASDQKLAPDQTKLVNVCFVPVQSGLRMASIRFYTNIPKTYPDQRDTSQFLVQITGTGVPFGKLALGGPATMSSLVGDTNCFVDTIWNKGSSDLTVTSYGIFGPNANADYTLGSIPSPTVIRAGGFQLINLCFHPTSRGLSAATITVSGTTNGRTLTQSLAINGNGQVGCMSATPNPVTFGTKYPGITLVGTSDSTAVTVTNCGDVALDFGAATTSVGYSVTPSRINGIAPNGTAVFMVHFAPTAIGAASGMLTLSSLNESSVSAQTLTLSGVGGGVVIVGSGVPSVTRVGQTSNFTITLQNTGNVAWNPASPVFTTGASDYTVSGSLSSSSIAPNTSATLGVTFAPTTGGVRPGALSFGSMDVTPISGIPYNFNGGAADAGVSEITSSNGFSIGASYPNPASTSANVVVTLPTSAKVTVALVRIDGSQVASVFEGSLSEGQHTLNFDVSNIASGTYFYTLESGTTRLVRQMVVAK
jgi:hypothetical protein